ncbi:tetratricopeptide repeat protein 29-like [Saccoglossus kowalevskii]|uniref:Tetratricopeptide repeat protein 29 n=1 Tax=Saccoglossus kowalevskii TaxID=10224 RepID=A0ABM0GV02_SACKO|nr:PREDICTED: tetratricopeptide repeat protein 29-like isoform X1 [Saccoglossus kowalevskii]XP_006820389.1 PREDICTED: tetratricopeptide repeat protein 29-like isoform X2 [Saccoglossus kowalevskii]
MAAPLPAIPPGQGHGPGLQTIQQHRVPSPPSKISTGSISRSTYRPGQRLIGKREREQQAKQQMLRAKQPDLSHMDTARYRNTYFHTLCVEMLKDGFHRSFSELFALIKRQKAEREAAGPDSLIWNLTLLEDEYEKLDKLKQYLTEAEAALRLSNMEAVYTAQHKLAEYFKAIEDYWLSDHFYTLCLDTSLQIKGDGRRKEAEANCNMGLGYEHNRVYDKAAEHFETFYKLCSRNKSWRTTDGGSLHAMSCDHLMRLYTTMAENFQKAEKKDLQQAIQYLLKAFEMAKESGDTAKEGVSSYKLGLAYKDIGDPETALMYHEGYMEICKQLGDQEGMGKSCEAIAAAYESQGKAEDAIRYLEMFVEVAEKSKQEKALGRASACLGTIYNIQGQYLKAAEYFGKAYNIARSTGDNLGTSETRVHYGIASAHRILLNYTDCVEKPSKKRLEALILYKNGRGEQFAEPVKDSPPPKVEEKKEEKKEEEKKEEKSENKEEEKTEENEKKD